jgi:CheY-like chemotaxis protein
MPQQNGYELMRAIRALPNQSGSRILTIALTARGTRSDHDRALKAGFRTHLVKPVDAAELVAAVADLVAASASKSRGRRSTT